LEVVPRGSNVEEGDIQYRGALLCHLPPPDASGEETRV
jgi:hypothetical protein